MVDQAVNIEVLKHFCSSVSCATEDAVHTYLNGRDLAKTVQEKAAYTKSAIFQEEVA